MPSESLRLVTGSVIHIKNFSSRGHSPKNKYLFVLGKHSVDRVLCFLISSQMHYLRMETHRDEVVRLPARSALTLSQESIIQCFELEDLSEDVLLEDFENGIVENEGILRGAYLYKVRNVVKNSKLLTPAQIDLIVQTMDLK